MISFTGGERGDISWTEQRGLVSFTGGESGEISEGGALASLPFSAAHPTR